MATDAENRAWVIQEYQLLLGRNPTKGELDQDTYSAGKASRGDIERWIAANHADERVRYLYKTQYGRDPNPGELRNWTATIQSRQYSHDEVVGIMANDDENLLRDKSSPVDTAAKDDARVALNGTLDRYGLGSLKDWAWEQIQSGHSPDRISEDLRGTPEYQDRFKGLIDRQKAGLPPMTETDYMNYEDRIRTANRTRGLPDGFYSSKDDIAKLAVSNISGPEYEERLDEGFTKVNNAPAEIKQAFASIFGPSGDAALATYMLDGKLAIPLLKQQVAAAEDQGIGTQFGFNLMGTAGKNGIDGLAAAGRAGDLAAAGIGGDQARSGFVQLSQLKPLFAETVSEHQDMTAEQQGLDAVFGLGDGTELDRRRRTRSAATAGGGGSVLGQAGLGAGSAE